MEARNNGLRYSCLVYVDNNKRKEFDIFSLKSLAEKYKVQLSNPIVDLEERDLYEYESGFFNYNPYIYDEFCCMEVGDEQEYEPNESEVGWKDGPYFHKFLYETLDSKVGAEFLKDALELKHVVFVTLRKKLRRE